MSDFFGDDFTKELKSYFLQSVLTESDKFLDLADEKLWKRISQELIEQSESWVADARSNDFNFFAVWLEGQAAEIKGIQTRDEFLNRIGLIKKYADHLFTERVDTQEYSSKLISSKVDNTVLNLLHCKSEDQHFAIPVLSIIEIGGALPLCQLPEAKNGVLGLIPYRGEAIPVVNLQDYGFQQLTSKNLVNVICEVNKVKFILQVSKTESLINVASHELQDLDVGLSKTEDKLVQKFFIKDDLNIMILDLEILVAA